MGAKTLLGLIVFVVFFLLPASSQAPKSCTKHNDCDKRCCDFSEGTCSNRDVLGGETVESRCECTINSAKTIPRSDPAMRTCRCNDRDDCKADHCCIEDTHKCVPEKKLGGVVVEDKCQCLSGEILGNECTCEEDAHCQSDCCNTETKKCIAGDVVKAGDPADFQCQCVNEVLDEDTGLCLPDCVSDDECQGENEICCPEDDKCGERGIRFPSACGDPHMTGFRGQKFDFTGIDGDWYALISDPRSMHLNMRVSAPIPSLPEITYITGLSLRTADADGVDHTVVISVNDPHNMDSACPEGIYPCLADGSLSVVADGNEVLVAPGTVTLGPDVQVTAVNIPGECRSFGFETYWERKQLEYAQSGRRLLSETLSIGEWILADPTATNMAECTTYVAHAMSEEGAIFAHQSEHASFQIATPTATIRLSHGRLHQLPMRDPTDQFDLPDHMTWQMNMAIEHADISHDAQGIIGETFVPTFDDRGNIIMHGMECIRGTEADYAVTGPLGVIFSQGEHNF